MPKLTPWYPETVTPVRSGVYQRLYANGDSNIAKYCYWTGARWKSWHHTPQLATLVEAVSLFQELPWRGIAK